MPCSFVRFGWGHGVQALQTSSLVGWNISHDKNVSIRLAQVKSDRTALSRNPLWEFWNQPGRNVIVDGGFEADVDGTVHVVPGQGFKGLDWIDQVLEVHNAERASYTGVGPLVWDKSLASGAELYADTCSIKPSLTRNLGESIAMGSGVERANAPKMLAAIWAGEVFDWNCTLDRCSSTLCSHHRQMIWPATTKVGCGFSTCGSNTFILVCRYDVAGNVQNKHPFSNPKQCALPSHFSLLTTKRQGFLGLFGGGGGGGFGGFGGGGLGGLLGGAGSLLSSALSGYGGGGSGGGILGGILGGLGGGGIAPPPPVEAPVEAPTEAGVGKKRNTVQRLGAHSCSEGDVSGSTYGTGGSNSWGGSISDCGGHPPGQSGWGGGLAGWGTKNPGAQNFHISINGHVIQTRNPILEWYSVDGRSARVSAGVQTQADGTVVAESTGHVEGTHYIGVLPRNTAIGLIVAGAVVGVVLVAVLGYVAFVKTRPSYVESV
jgi:hypothetical protein